MAKEKLGFEDFISLVDSDNQLFVTKLHMELTDKGCKIQVKEAKSGYAVAYLLNKKTLANYVFRKKGLILRIYANHINDYMEILDDLPNEMIVSVKKAPVCKCLIDPATYNQKCAKGYDFILKGERQQKCRYHAFMFLVNDESKPFIHNFVINEVMARL